MPGRQRPRQPPLPACPVCRKPSAVEYVGWDTTDDQPRFHCRRCGALWTPDREADDG